MKKFFLFVAILFCVISVNAQAIKMAKFSTNQYGEMKDGDMSVVTPISKNLKLGLGDIAYIREQNAFDEEGNRVALNGDIFPEVASEVVFSYSKNYTTYVTNPKTGKVYRCYMTFRKCYVKRIWYE